MPERFKVTKATGSDNDDAASVRDEEAGLGKLLGQKQGEFFYFIQTIF